MNKLLLGVLLSLSLAASAQVYVSKDAQGNPVYSDTPPADGSVTEKIEIGNTNITTPPPLIPTSQAAKKEQAGKDYAVTISSPAQETSIPMGPGNFTVSASSKPQASKGQTLRLYIDGQPWGAAHSGGSWALTNIFRGAHDLTVKLVDANDRTLATSDPVRVYVHRPSVNFKNR